MCKHCTFGLVRKETDGRKENGKNIVIELYFGTCPCCDGKWYDCKNCCEEHG